MAETFVSEWVDLGYAAERTGFDEATLRQLIEDGDMPAMQVAATSRKRTFRKVPRRLVDEAYAAVMAGGQVELRSFARAWSERNAVPEVA